MRKALGRLLLINEASSLSVGGVEADRQQVSGAERHREIGEGLEGQAGLGLSGSICMSAFEISKLARATSGQLPNTRRPAKNHDDAMGSGAGYSYSGSPKLQGTLLQLADHRHGIAEQ